jgi:nucleoside-diphosphate kinase
MTERTLVLIKPDGVGRRLTGQILDRYLAKGYDLVAMQLRTCTPELADAHYADHVAKDWYPTLRAFVTSGPLVAAVLEGPRVIDAVRALNGATDGIAAAPGSIRGDWATSNRENLVHGSDSPESAAREIGIWFPELA